MPNNSTVYVSPDTPVIVEQGPTWLVKFYLAPPPWVNPVIKAIGALAVVLVAYRLYQRGWVIDFETQHEMQLTVATIVGIMSATLAMVNWFEFSYLIDVSVGFLVGYGSVYVPQTRLLGIEWPAALEDPVDRAALIWALLAVTAYALPMLLAVDGDGMLLGTSRLVLAGVSVLMVFYNAAVLKE